VKEQTGFSDVDASGRASELVDYLALTAGHVAEFRRNGYELLRLKPGAAVLDVGCGAGEVCVELAARVGPKGKVAGIDLSQAMVEAARKAAAASGHAIDLRVGTAYALPFADGAFDAVRCERVFQHLDDPEAALREILRVTRSGGRVMALDPDHGQAGLGLDDPAHRRVYKAIQRQMERMIVNPHSGTRLRGMFVRAGLVDLALAGFVLDLEQPAYMTMFFVRERIEAAVAAGDISANDGSDFIATLDARHRAGTFHGNAVGYNVAGTKP
jgi:ubiquinone/menaquinone biosynthesis C-methylase UbiE